MSACCSRSERPRLLGDLAVLLLRTRVSLSSAGRPLAIRSTKTPTGLGHNLGHNWLFGSITVPLSARFKKHGEMSEWLKEHAWKACVEETLPWVRIPLSPP